ncbi:MAG: polysaccharide pyruvyl transferase CsaB [Thermovirgaceae bacterium]|nr:polysaccharide pyruvyl transferase CsaB [Thermovirgaceae bacterium]
MKRPIDVTLCGYYGFGNLGDELIAAGLVSLLEKNGVLRERIAIMTASWTGKQSPDGVLAVDRWRPDRVLSTLRSSRTLLLGGGGLFQDSTSIRSCIYYWAVTRMARATGCLPWAFGQSIGPLKSSLAATFARNALALCASRAVRDEGSMEWLTRWDLEGEITPDPVIALSGSLDKCDTKGKYLLVNLRPWRGGISAAAAGAAAAIAGEMGIPLLGVALSEDDVKVMEELRDGGVFRPEEITLVRSMDDARSVWCSGRGAVGMRLHFCVISALANIPCVAIPYDPKVSWFARDWGLPVWEGDGPLPFMTIGTDHRERIFKASKVLEDAFGRILGTVLERE